jgi:hypothetical protein
MIQPLQVRWAGVVLSALSAAPVAALIASPI